MYLFYVLLSFLSALFDSKPCFLSRIVKEFFKQESWFKYKQNVMISAITADNSSAHLTTMPAR